MHGAGRNFEVKIKISGTKNKSVGIFLKQIEFGDFLSKLAEMIFFINNCQS